jgi:hypothetical protein
MLSSSLTLCPSGQDQLRLRNVIVVVLFYVADRSKSLLNKDHTLDPLGMFVCTVVQTNATREVSRAILFDTGLNDQTPLPEWRRTESDLDPCHSVVEEKHRVSLQSLESPVMMPSVEWEATTAN